mgnify:CR=1 FL=1
MASCSKAVCPILLRRLAHQLQSNGHIQHKMGYVAATVVQTRQFTIVQSSNHRRKFRDGECLVLTSSFNYSIRFSSNKSGDKDPISSSSAQSTERSDTLIISRSKGGEIEVTPGPIKPNSTTSDLVEMGLQPDEPKVRKF